MLVGDKCYRGKSIGKEAGGGSGYALKNRPLGEGLVEKGKLSQDLRRGPATCWERHSRRRTVRAQAWEQVGACPGQERAVAGVSAASREQSWPQELRLSPLTILESGSRVFFPTYL